MPARLELRDQSYAIGLHAAGASIPAVILLTEKKTVTLGRDGGNSYRINSKTNPKNISRRLK